MLYCRRQAFATTCLVKELQEQEEKEEGGVVMTGKKGKKVVRAVEPGRKRQRTDENGEKGKLHVYITQHH